MTALGKCRDCGGEIGLDHAGHLEHECAKAPRTRADLERLARETQRSWHPHCSAHDECAYCEHMTAAILAALERAVAEEQEANCKAVCPWCRELGPPRHPSGVSDFWETARTMSSWVHDVPDSKRAVDCRADKIRSRSGETK